MDKPGPEYIRFLREILDRMEVCIGPEETGAPRRVVEVWIQDIREFIATATANP